MSLTWPRKRPVPAPVACGHGPQIAGLEKQIAGLRAQVARQADEWQAMNLRLTGKSRDLDDTQRLLDAAIGQVAAEQQQTRLAAERLVALEKQGAADRVAADERVARLLRAVELADADRDAHDAEMRRLTVALRECAEENERLRGLAAVQAEPGEWPDCDCPARRALDAATTKAEQILQPGINNESTTGGER